jgi:hypothetical protein
MATNTDDENEPDRYWLNLARPLYGKHERARPYAIDQDSQRGFAAIRKAYQEQKDDTHT